MPPMVAGVRGRGCTGFVIHGVVGRPRPQSATIPILPIIVLLINFLSDLF